MLTVSTRQYSLATLSKRSRSATSAVYTRFFMGFTLIELLIVMAIIALLLTIALPRYFNSVDKSKEVALKEDLQVMRVGIDRFYADKGHFPEHLEDLVTQKYLRSVPIDPITESSATWIIVPSTDSTSPGIVDIKSGAQGSTKDGTPYGQL